MALQEQFSRELERQGIPLYGVSYGRLNDRSTWRIDYKPAATPLQRDTAEALKLTFDSATDTAWADEQADVDLNLKGLKALAQATFELKSNAWTAQQFRDRIKAIWKTL